jgi:hypothetical protein
MSEYASIKNLYASNGQNGPGHKRGPEFGFSNPAFGSVTNWLVTEKVDGMNIRVVFKPYGWSDDPSDPDLQFYGRTDRAQLPGDLLAHLQETITVPNLLAAFDYDLNWALGDDDKYAWQHGVVLYGEGYGPGIQKAGHAYGGTKRFILFDVKVGDSWLDWDDVVDVAQNLGIDHVPVLARNATLDVAKACVGGTRLLSDPAHVEGIVARAEPQLFDKWGQRVMFKYKVRDL